MTAPDLPLVKGEIKTAVTAYLAGMEADRRAGKSPRACLPPAGQANIDSKALLSALEAIPPAKRGMSVKVTFYSFMDRRYPCARATP